MYDTHDWLAGGGEMGRLIRAMDWSQTALGALAGWPQSLKTAVRILLTSRYPMFVWWGRELTILYNDAYIPIHGAGHPQALGRSAPEVWASAWPVIGPQTEQVLSEGRATWNEAIQLTIERHGFPEETYFTFSYSPLSDDSGGVGGVFCACIEDTERILSERRLQTLRDLGERDLPTARTAEHACRAAAAVLATNLNDVPFALIYLLDDAGQHAHLVATVNLPAATPASPPTVTLGSANDVWDFQRVLASGQGVLTDDLPTRFGHLPAGPWADDQTRQALMLPLAKAGVHESPAGFFVVGVSPRLAFTAVYRSFLELAADQLAIAIANARAYEVERARAEALAEIDRAKTTFFSNISHEFRTPLALLLGPLEAALSGATGSLPPQLQDDLTIAHRNALRLLKLVNTLLDFSRSEAGRIAASYEPTDLTALTAELASIFRSAIESAGMQLVVDCPPLAMPVYVDRELWEKIVLNLLSNAFKFTFEGQITVQLRQVDAVVELAVCDTGIGIPAEEIPHLFERFHRIKGARGRSYEGSGIGLALVQELVKLHGGTVRVESEVNRGSTFIVSIPLGTAHLPPDRIGAVRPRSSNGVRSEAYLAEALRWLPDELDPAVEVAPGPVVKSLPDSLLPASATSQHLSTRILLADDNADMRLYVGRLLAQCGYDVVAVPDGVAALQAGREAPFDLLLADVMMPGLDGFGLLSAWRADEQLKTIPVILLSARAGEAANVAGMEAGADDYLIKPFSARELLARVEAHVKLARLRREATEREHALRQDVERRAREAEEKQRILEVLLAHIPEGITMVGGPPDFPIIANSRMAEQVLGKPAATLRGMLAGYHAEAYGIFQVDGVTPPLPDQLPLYRATRYGETIIDEEWVIEGPDSTRLAVLVNVAPIRDAGGAIIGAINCWRDITERKRAETALREAEARQAFLLKLSDALRSLSDPVEIQAEAARVLGEYLQADRVMYGEVEGVDDEVFIIRRDYRRPEMPSTVRRHRFDDYGGYVAQELRAGRTLVVADVSAMLEHTAAERAAYASVSIGAYIAVPLVKAGRIAAYLAVNQRTPRAWTLQDVALVEETAERTWAAVERARAEAALRESEEKYRTLFDSIDEGFCIIEVLFDDNGNPADYRFLEVNPAFTRQTGIADALGRTIRELLPQHEAYWFDLYGHIALTGDPLRFVERSNALGRVYDVYAFRIGAPDERRVAVIFNDITQRMQAEETLRASERRQVFLLQLNDRLLPLADPEQIQYEAACALGEHLQVSRVGYAEDQGDGETIVVTRNYTDGVPGIEGRYHYDDYGPELLRAFRAGRTVVRPDIANDPTLTAAEKAAHAALQLGATVNVPLVRAGHLVAVLFMHDRAARHWSADELALIETVAARTWDAVERARAEVRLQQLYVQEQAARAQAEAANRLKDEFLATVSHELRTPLTAFLGYAHLLQRRTGDEAYVKRTVAKMLQSAQTQAALIEDLLDVSRIVSGKLRLDSAPINLITVIHAALDTVRPAVEAKGQQLQVELDPAASPVLGDPGRLQQVVWNLLANATKFTPPGGQIAIRLTADGNDTTLTVRDSGQGIAADFLPYVFDRFRQANSSSQRTYGGLGLGLAIVRHLVELHGGSVAVTSPGVGQGATFSMRLPLLGAALALGATNGDVAALAVEPAPLSGLRVLVVDDQPLILDLVDEILTADGATVQTCGTAQEAFALVQSWRPDVLVSDIAMPNEDGYWLIEQVRSLPPEAGGATPAVALTAYVRMEDRLRVLAAGFQQYVPKPIDTAELRTVIAQFSVRERES